jgi:hypothetical protein
MATIVCAVVVIAAAANNKTGSGVLQVTNKGMIVALAMAPLFAAVRRPLSTCSPKWAASPRTSI